MITAELKAMFEDRQLNHWQEENGDGDGGVGVGAIRQSQHS